MSGPEQNPPSARLTSGLPDFANVTADQVEADLRALIVELEAELEAFEGAIEPSWEGAIEPLERIDDRLRRSWGVVTHLMGVRNSDPLRSAHDAVQPDVVRFSLRLAQSRPLYEALEALSKGPGFEDLAAARRRIVLALLRDARLAGVGLEGEAREQLNAIQLELAELSSRFGNQLLDATQAFGIWLDQPDEVDGLPESALALAAQAARNAGRPEASAASGPWRITLEAPSYLPFLEHARRRDLRERLYRGLVTRASAGEHDNGPVLARILELRREQARLLGFDTYAELSLASKMAPGVPEVERLLEELRSASLEPARRDHAELEALAREQGLDEPIALWDVAFYAERLREARYAYSDEALRPYFPLPRVLDGLFRLAERLFEIAIAPADGEAPVWHRDVRFFRVRDRAGADVAAFYLDPFSRPGEKRGGAWMDECVGRSALFGGPAGPRLPVAHLVCNQAPPVDGKPSLMSFSEVETLFHEFGHGLQHMLTTVDLGLASGIRNIEWDAVELPSQFMENWCYREETVREISAHVETGEPLPRELFEKVRAARTFRAGSAMLRQLYFALTDLELHHRHEPGSDETPFDVAARIAEKTTVIPPLSEDRFLCSFGHIFAGGYAAGYYSYKWAEVLSADAFAAFEEAGLDDPEAVAARGREFRDTVLALGGSRPPMEVFTAFRGREPSTEALLRHAGLRPARVLGPAVVEPQTPA